MITLETPHKGQAIFLKSKAKRKVLMCGRRWGKSLICKNLAIERALKKQLVAYVTPTFSLGKVFYKELLQILPPEYVAEQNQTDLYIKLITGGSIRFFTGESPDSFRGHKFHLVIMDECAFIKDLKNAWQTAIQPTLTDYNGEAVFISTPRGQGFFYELYNKGNNKEKNWESFKYTTYDNPFIDKSVIEEAKKELPEIAFQQEFLAIPNASALNCFGNHITKNIIDTLVNKRAKAIGIDVASTFDYTCIIGLAELEGKAQMTHYQHFQADWNITKQRIVELPRSIDKIIDNTGVGAPIFDELRLTVANIYPFKFTSASKPALIKELILAVEQGKVSYIQEVADEMQNFELTYNFETGRTKYAATAGNKDDKVIALALAWHIYNKRTKKSNSWSIGMA